MVQMYGLLCNYVPNMLRSDTNWTVDIFLKLFGGAVCENENVFSVVSDILRKSFCQILGIMSGCENTAGKCPENSLRASGYVDDVYNTWQNWKNSNITGWKRGAIHVVDVDEAINFERQQNLSYDN